MDPRIALVSLSLVQQRWRKQKSRAKRPVCKTTLVSLWAGSLCCGSMTLFSAWMNPAAVRRNNLLITFWLYVHYNHWCRCCIHNKAALYEGRLVPQAGGGGGGAPWKWWYQLLLLVPWMIKPTMGYTIGPYSFYISLLILIITDDEYEFHTYIDSNVVTIPGDCWVSVAFTHANILNGSCKSLI